MTDIEASGQTSRPIATNRPRLPEERAGYRPFYKEKKKKVGQYMLTDPLAEGTFGRYRYGIHLWANQKVAVKILDKKVLTRKELARRCLRREGLVLQKLFHPNIIRMYEAMETRKSYYLVFELADGDSFLEFLIKKRCLLETEAKLFTREIVSAVDHMHVSGIIHRDLRLENFLLDSRGRIKITGFGIAVLENEAPLPSNRCGSPAYAAPEVFSCRKQGPGVDIWSIGVCLFAMLIGHLPFLPAKMVSLPEIHSLVLKGVTMPTFLSKDCYNLISRMLKPYLSERITMEELLRHKWLLETDEKHVPRQPSIPKLEPPLIDHHLVEYINYMHGFSKESIIKSVQERHMNNISATYHLYIKSIQNGFHVPEISELLLSRHDTSEDFLQSTQSRIIHEYIDNLLAETESPRIDDVDLSVRQSIPLYKSCITCLQETRCNRHGPDDANMTSIGPRGNMTSIGPRGNMTNESANNKYFHLDIPAHIKRYLLDSEIQSIQDLKEINPDLFLSIGADVVKLPEINAKHLCQQEAPKALTNRKPSSMSLPLTPPNSCHGNSSPRRPYSVHSYTLRKHKSSDSKDMISKTGDQRHNHELEAIPMTEHAQNKNSNQTDQETYQEERSTVKEEEHIVKKVEETVPEGEETHKERVETVQKGEETVQNVEVTVQEGKETHKEEEETVQKGEVTVQEGEETDKEREETVQISKMTVPVDVKTVEKGEETVEKGEETDQKGEETNQEGEGTFRDTSDNKVLEVDDDNSHHNGVTAVEARISKESNMSTPRSNHNSSSQCDKHILNVTMETCDLHRNRLQDDLDKTNSSITYVTKNVHDKPSTKNDLDLTERSPLGDLDPDKGLRDPYAEEIWVAMYPRTNKINTHFNVSPRIPVSFNPPLSSRKPLTSRRSGNSNPSLAIFRKMASSFHGNDLTPIVESYRYNSIHSRKALPNIPTVTSPTYSSSSPLDVTSTTSESGSSEAIISVIVKSSSTN